MPVLETGSAKALEIDKNAKIANKWRWEWMEETTSSADGSVTIRVAEWCEKLDIAGNAFCTVSSNNSAGSSSGTTSSNNSAGSSSGTTSKKRKGEHIDIRAFVHKFAFDKNRQNHVYIIFIN